MAKTANVLVEVPIGFLLATPNPIAAGNLSREVFILTLTDIDNSFKETLSGNITLGGDFSGLTVSDIAVDPSNNKVASLKLSGDLAYNTGSGTITVGGDTLASGSALTANVKVAQPAVTTFDLTIAHDGQGSSIPGIGTHQYNSGATVALSATPESGWRFVRWAVGSTTFFAHNISVVMDSNKTATAVFSRLPHAIVDSIAYSASTNKKDLHMDVSVVDPAGNLVTGSTAVSISLRRDGNLLKTLSGTTANGRIRFTESYHPNIPRGTYTSVVTSVSNANYNWNGTTPDNSFVMR
ncbi:MAG: hypothetical protein KGZ56_10440 [Dethiobacter sp.]|nr:hypothetical protein [Dethiobacter sp.]MBS3897252.1 hypothetical protein [Dethiobacter sp.]